MYAGLVQHPRFSQKLDEYREIYARMDDVWADIDFKLGRDPRLGVQIEDTEFRVYETDTIGDTPSFWILYTHEPEKRHVTLLSIKAAHAAEDG